MAKSRRKPKSIEATHIPVNKIRPSKFNPNKMTDEEFAGLKKEIARQGEILKPIVVRNVGDHFVVIDGEHTLRAAKQLDFTKVACQCIAADEFEAHRQTYVRNLHGQNDAVKTGRLFQRMKRLRGVSNRKLAGELGIHESTIRNYLHYPEAARVRNRYAPRRGASQISLLKVQQIREYLTLPADRRDEWLDRGGSHDEAVRIKQSVQSNEKKSQEGERSTSTQSQDRESSIPVSHETKRAVSDGELRHASFDEARNNKPETASEDPEIDQRQLNQLKTSWENASPKIRRKFLSQILADSHAVQFLRRILKTQPQ